MSYCFRSFVSAGALLLVLIAPSLAAAQGNPEPHSFKFNTGQGLQPVFEGWSKNPDGSFQMHFGYFNRNYTETLVVPVGADNKLEPGAPDRGQPTVFGTRIHRKEFSVSVPKDWAGTKRELVWSVTVRGVTEKAIAWLQPEWEIDPIYGGRTLTEAMKKNKAPALTLEAPATVTFPNAFALTATVTDDGLPVPRKQPQRAAAGQETPPTLKPLPDQPEVPVNVPTVQAGRAGGGGGRGQQQGPVVNWMLWRGPAAVTFDATTTPVKDGRAVVNVALTKPGTYQFRARASDGELTDEKDVTVTVK